MTGFVVGLVMQPAPRGEQDGGKMAAFSARAPGRCPDQSVPHAPFTDEPVPPISDEPRSYYAIQDVS